MPRLLAGSDRIPGWAVPAGLFGVALVLRLVHLSTIGDSLFSSHLWLDLAFFDEWGQRIAAGEWIGTSLFYQDPLYPYFLGVVYSVFGHRPAVAIAIQSVLGALVPLFVYAATTRGLGKSEAIVAGLFAATYLPAIFYEGLLLKSWMDLFLVAAAVWCLALAIHRGSAFAWTATGLLLGAACLARGNLILVLPALAAWILVDGASDASRPSFRGRAAAAAWLLAGAGLVLGISVARNFVVSGGFVLTTAQAGQNFFLGNNSSNTEGECDPPPFLRTNPKYEEADFTAEAQRRTGREMTPRAISRYWFWQGVDWIRERPADWLRLTWRKLRNFWGAYEIPDNIDLYVYREWAPVLRSPLPGFGVVAPLALLGAVFAFRRPGWPRAQLVFLAVYTTAVVLFFVLSRYRLAALPPLFAFAGVGAVELGRRIRSAIADQSRRASALRAAGLAAACFCAVHLPVRAPADDPAFRLASALGLPVRVANVATEHFNLGVVYAKTGDLERAEQELRVALREEPRQVKVHLELGKVIARAGRIEEAIACFERAAELEPRQPATFHTLGILHRRAGNLAAAEAAFREALRLDPRRAGTRKELEALGKAGS